MYRRPGERYNQCYIQETVSFGLGSCIFWGGISMETKTELVIINCGGQGGNLTAERYVTDIIEDHVVPYAGFVGDGFVLMQDNARPRTARIVSDFLQEAGIRTLNWPANSPDLNLIEHLWDELKRRVHARNPPPMNHRDLKQALYEEWETIPQETAANLIKSMRNRLQAVIQARGGNTRY